MQCAATQHVQMQVRHCLSGVVVGIDHDPIPALRNALLRRDIARVRTLLTEKASA